MARRTTINVGCLGREGGRKKGRHDHDQPLPPPLATTMQFIPGIDQQLLYLSNSEGRLISSFAVEDGGGMEEKSRWFNSRIHLRKWHHAASFFCKSRHEISSSESVAFFCRILPLELQPQQPQRDIPLFARSRPRFFSQQKVSFSSSFSSRTQRRRCTNWRQRQIDSSSSTWRQS